MDQKANQNIPYLATQLGMVVETGDDLNTREHIAIAKTR
jgi:hypothetical protein